MHAPSGAKASASMRHISAIPESSLQDFHCTAPSLTVLLGQHAFGGGGGQPWRVVNHDSESRLQHGESRCSARATRTRQVGGWNVDGPRAFG